MVDLAEIDSLAFNLARLQNACVAALVRGLNWGRERTGGPGPQSELEKLGGKGILTCGSKDSSPFRSMDRGSAPY